MFWGRNVRNNATCVPTIKCSIAITKAALNMQEDFLPQQIGLKCKAETNKVLDLQHSFVWR